MLFETLLPWKPSMMLGWGMGSFSPCASLLTQGTHYRVFLCRLLSQTGSPLQAILSPLRGPDTKSAARRVSWVDHWMDGWMDG